MLSEIKKPKVLVSRRINKEMNNILPFAKTKVPFILQREKRDSIIRASTSVICRTVTCHDNHGNPVEDNNVDRSND